MFRYDGHEIRTPPYFSSIITNARHICTCSALSSDMPRRNPPSGSTLGNCVVDLGMCSITSPRQTFKVPPQANLRHLESVYTLHCPRNARVFDLTTTFNDRKANYSQTISRHLSPRRNHARSLRHHTDLIILRPSFPPVLYNDN
ncbi:hypothetical protein SODALDRAFT_73696 [Sodiomyces alkalinus F11]|uniref:Uncharacterized protein n=1 Tax=Sodiomyces alkalinus (strain CBS 110278 / VKM F-3762 / F11) TaxID=1314773 RepID=A0A3N2PK87_SODAK|nr:hypothetical protein SODALDRAFT_73696 [Sodiomyces alkalinus F11]ROT34919.1 hypothetical protein SODALDRAFT_73696 [Sodiomyces alkalinus F11]